MNSGIFARLIGLVAIAMTVGCASRPKPQPVAVAAPTTRPVLSERPVIDIARGGGGLPLDDVGDIESQSKLVEGLRKGYARRLILPDADSWIKIVGADHRHLDALRIDLSNQAVRSDYRPSQYEAPGQPEPGISARHFEYLAWPLLYQNGQTRWRISASDAKFSLLRDRAGHHSLVLSDAREGSFEFSVPLADVKPMILRAATANPRAGFELKDFDIQFASDNPRSLSIDMRFEAAILFVPTTLTMHARADIDPWCNVQLSEISCKGEDAGGAVVAAFAESWIEKQNGKVLPLVKWPGDQVVLTDVQIKVDESLSISATFGRQKQ